MRLMSPYCSGEIRTMTPVKTAASMTKMKDEDEEIFYGSDYAFCLGIHVACVCF